MGTKILNISEKMRLALDKKQAGFNKLYREAETIGDEYEIDPVNDVHWIEFTDKSVAAFDKKRNSIYLCKGRTPAICKRDWE